MRYALSALLVLHGLIHLMGVAKAFGYASLPQLKVPISPASGVLWLAATLALLAAAVLLHTWPRWWWLVALAGLVLSTLAILPSWSDAKFGTPLNVLVLLAAILGYWSDGPASLRAEYDRDVAGRLASLKGSDAVTGPDRITEADLAPLPAPVQRYLRLTGVVGRPRPSYVHVRMHGRIRSGADAPWMPFRAEQHNVFTEPARLFYMDASRFLVPFNGYHRYVGPSATMRVKLLGAVPVVDASGEAMTRAETVTLFNDMCVMAPGTLVDPHIRWESVDGRRVGATFSNANQTVRAELVFNEAGELVNFWSDDRLQASPDGRTSTPRRWSTPLGGYRAFGPFRLAGRGEARWHDGDTDYAYIELDIDDVRYN